MTLYSTLSENLFFESFIYLYISILLFINYEILETYSIKVEKIEWTTKDLVSKLVNYQHFVTLSHFLSLLAFYCWNILEQIFIVLLYHFKSFKILLFYHIAAMPSSPLENENIILGIIWYILYVKFSIVCKIHLHIFIFISQDFNCLSYFFSVLFNW